MPLDQLFQSINGVILHKNLFISGFLFRILFSTILTHSLSHSSLIGVRAKSNQCSVHCLSKSLTWTTLLLGLLVPLSSWWGHCAILIFMVGATSLQLPYSLWLRACFGLTHPKGPKACQGGLSPPFNMQLFSVHPSLRFLVSFKAFFEIAQFFPMSQWCCSVHCVERFV